MEIILHRAQDIIPRNSVSQCLELAYKLGVRSFEIDILHTRGNKIQVCHPYNAANNIINGELDEVIEWSLYRDVKIYLDVKYPLSWENKFEDWKIDFNRLDKQKFFIISYDIDYLLPFLDELELGYGYFVSQKKPTKDGKQFYLVPYSSTNLKVYEGYKNVIITNVDTIQKLVAIKNLNYIKAMLNTEKGIAIFKELSKF